MKICRAPLMLMGRLNTPAGDPVLVTLTMCVVSVDQALAACP
jgi:hypothetical protein